MGYNNLGLYDMTPGDPAVKNSWGTLTNVNLNIISNAVSGETSVDVAGDTNIVLTSAQGQVLQDPAAFFDFSGVLTGNVIVLWPSGVTRVFSAANNTTGAFTLKLGVSNGSGGAAGTTATVPQGANGFFFSDGTDVVLIGLSLNSPTFTGTVTMPDGSTWSSSGLTLNDAATFTGQTVTGGAFTGGRWDNGIIGGGMPAAGSFTTLSAWSTVSGAGFSTYLASPPAIGGTSAAAGAFTTLSATGTISSNSSVTAGAARTNQAALYGSDTTDPIALVAQGSDTNISINLVPKGTGGVQISGTPLPISPFSVKSTSSPQVIPSPGGTLTVAHGLGAEPFDHIVFMVCASAENNWSIGDKVRLASHLAGTSAGTGGINTYADATDVFVIVSTGGINMLDKSSGSPVVATLAKWNFIVKAYV